MLLAAAVLFFADSHPAGAAGPPAPGVATQAIQAGKVLFDAQCASCHGAGGRGDGPSAVGFGTKPADFTDGRVLNPLPDEFLATVIRHGGPAMGLAPTMPAFSQFLSAGQMAQVIAYVRTLAQPPYDPARALPLVTVPGAPRQPIFFNHVIHAGSFGIDCQYCHTDARRSNYAGLPSVTRCVGCHKIVGAQDNPEIKKVLDYAQRGEPIPWLWVFKVPEFTTFPHKSHVRGGVTCQTCHGPIERMPVVGAATGPRLTNDMRNLVGLRTAAPPLSMGWCIECHRAKNIEAAAKTPPGPKAPLDCFACHH